MLRFALGVTLLSMSRRREEAFSPFPPARAVPAAGEVEQFAYCAHNWWLARHGHDGSGAAVEQGMAAHASQGRAQRRAESARKESSEALRWMFRILAVAASGTFLTLEVVYLRGDPLHWLFLTTALVMVSASAALLTIAGLREREYRRKVIDAHLVPGAVRSAGWRGERILRDPEWGISGSPDYVMDTPHGPVPVESKTGKTPDQPHRGHELQLACYLRLLEAAGTPAEYGLLTYPDGVFRVAWDDRLRAELRGTLDAMAAAEATGRADRDHAHAGRCRGCSRRDACDQRLA